jgi:predicted TIM-barrel fold metal-dependent hydrolase
LYSSTWFERLVPTPEKELELVIAENDFIAASIAKHPERLVGFYSLHPTRDPVVALRDRYVGRPGMIGWKMHLPACGVDLANPEDFQKLEAAFAWCAAHEQCVLIHLFGGDEPLHLAERFWKLVEPHPKLQIVLAHCGTSGGYNDLPESLLRGYLELQERKPEFARAPIFFDLSGAVLIAETDGLPPTSAENCERLVAMMRKIGLTKFLYATDYPVFSSQDLQVMLETRLQLSADERDTIVNNRLPALESRRN